jgi:hypothetical protein
MSCELQGFLATLHRPEAAQAECLLERIVHPNRDCEFGRRHRFEAIRTVRDFRQAVPLATYEDLRESVDRMAAGQSGVLVSEPVRHFFITSGTTSASKLVPVTRAFMRDKIRALAVYWEAVDQRHPGLGQGRVTTNFADSGSFTRTSGGIPCSSESAFWARMTAATRQRSHFVPPAALSAVADGDARYYLLARLLLEEDLTMLMSLNPSTILVLLRKIEELADPLLDDLERGELSPELAIAPEVRRAVTDRCRAHPERARRIRRALRPATPRFHAADLWPRLAVIVSWQSSMQRTYLEMLAPYVASIPHDDYPTMASEGVIAIPLADPGAGAVLAADVHFFEFIPEEQAEDANPETLLAHQLELDRRYVVVLSTTGGLYRYNIGDVVRVRGFAGAAPRLEFLYRTGATCSLTGEKLTEEQVSSAMAAAVRRSRLGVVAFTAQPAAEGFPRYLFLVELERPQDRGRAKALLAAIDRELGRCNVEYRAKRSAQRLAPPELWIVRPHGYAALRRRRVAAGANDEQIKPAVLSRDPAFHRDLEIGERIRAD